MKTNSLYSPNAHTIPIVLTIPEAAAAYNLPPYTLRRWVKTGELKAVRSGRKIFINSGVLNDFLQGTPAAQAEDYGKIRAVGGVR